MLMKQCPKCGQKSCSSSDKGEWRCPYKNCGEDLKDVKSEQANRRGRRVMESLSDENLMEAYRNALELNLEKAFIQLLVKEMDRRGLEKPNDIDKK